MSQLQHDAWLVDLDGTLYWAPGVRAAMAAELLLFGLGKVRRLKRFREEHERLRMAPALVTGNPFREQLEQTASALGVSPKELEADVQTWMVERPSRYLSWFRRSSLLTEIGAFRGAGGRTALVSDYPATRKLAALGASDLFEVVVANGEGGGPRRLKPHPDGYLHAASALGVPPTRCLVIGDRPDADGAAAKAAGMEFRRVGR